MALKPALDEEPCPVCGDKVSGYHYGLLTCESCKVSGLPELPGALRVRASTGWRPRTDRYGEMTSS